MATTVTQTAKGVSWVNTNGQWLMYDPGDPVGSDITAAQLQTYQAQSGQQQPAPTTTPTPTTTTPSAPSMITLYGPNGQPLQVVASDTGTITTLLGQGYSYSPTTPTTQQDPRMAGTTGVAPTADPNFRQPLPYDPYIPPEWETRPTADPNAQLPKPYKPYIPPEWETQQDAIQAALAAQGGVQGMAGEGGAGGYSPFREYGDIAGEYYSQDRPYAGFLRKLQRGYGLGGYDPVSRWAQSMYPQQRGSWLMDYLNQEMMGQDATSWSNYAPQWGSRPGAFQSLAGQFTPEAMGQDYYDWLQSEQGAGDVFNMARAGTQMPGPMRNWFAGQQGNLYQQWLASQPPSAEGERRTEWMPWLGQYTGR